MLNKTKKILAIRYPVLHLTTNSSIYDKDQIRDVKKRRKGYFAT
jgi:hypothetical protein